jgi:hypothetical protein
MSTINLIGKATKNAAVARNAAKLSGNAVNETQKVAVEAQAALAAALAALGVVSGNGNVATTAKVTNLKEIEASVDNLQKELEKLDAVVGGDTFLMGRFGFKPNSNNNRTIGETNLKSALTALETISKNLVNNKINSTFNGSTSNKSPSRKQVIAALLGGVTKFTENVKSKHTTSLNAATAAKASAAAKAAEANERAAAAVAEKTQKNANVVRKNESLKSLSNQAILNFNKSLQSLVVTASKAMMGSPVEANGGLVLQEGENAKLRNLRNLLKNKNPNLMANKKIKEAYTKLTGKTSYKTGEPINELINFNRNHLNRLAGVFATQ